MVDEDKLFDGAEEEVDPAVLEDEEAEEDDVPEVPGEDDELEDEDELHPKHLNSLGFGVEEEEF